jgi:hypothetical protein
MAGFWMKSSFKKAMQKDTRYPWGNAVVLMIFRSVELTEESLLRMMSGSWLISVKVRRF